MSDDTRRFEATFHFSDGDTPPAQIALTTTPDDDPTLEEFLTEKLTKTKFTGFGDGKGGFTLINTELVAKVDVEAQP